jgi:hypothetical protein
MKITFPKYQAINDSYWADFCPEKHEQNLRIAISEYICDSASWKIVSSNITAIGSDITNFINAYETWQKEVSDWGYDLCPDEDDNEFDGMGNEIDHEHPVTQYNLVSKTFNKEAFITWAIKNRFNESEVGSFLHWLDTKVKSKGVKHGIVRFATEWDENSTKLFSAAYDKNYQMAMSVTKDPATISSLAYRMTMYPDIHLQTEEQVDAWVKARIAAGNLRPDSVEKSPAEALIIKLLQAFPVKCRESERKCADESEVMAFFDMWWHEEFADNLTPEQLKDAEKIVRDVICPPSTVEQLNEYLKMEKPRFNTIKVTGHVQISTTLKELMVFKHKHRISNGKEGSSAAMYGKGAGQVSSGKAGRAGYREPVSNTGTVESVPNGGKSFVFADKWDKQ